MPELPEVETIARDLRPLLVGRTIAAAGTDWPRVVAHPDADAFADGIRGRRVEGVGRRAKWLVLDLSDAAVLAIQVKMTGQLFVVPAGAPRDRHVHAWFDLDDGRQLRLRDMRKFARVGLYRRDEAGRVVRGAAGDVVPDELFGKHGPEPLEDAFTLAAFRQRLHARRGRLKPLLLDQSFVAGIGNIYADEALWRARLHPLRTVATLRRDDERRLYRAIRDVLSEAVERRGSSVDDYTAPEGDGEMQEHLQVYQRTALPCLRCGRPLRRIVVGQRGTHFCSWCQRLPASHRPGALALLRAERTRARARDDTTRRAATERTRRAAATRREVARRGPRWTELVAGEGVVGLRPGEGQGIASRSRAAAGPLDHSAPGGETPRGGDAEPGPGSSARERSLPAEAGAPDAVPGRGADPPGSVP